MSATKDEKNEKAAGRSLAAAAYALSPLLRACKNDVEKLQRRWAGHAKKLLEAGWHANSLSPSTVYRFSRCPPLFGVKQKPRAPSADSRKWRPCNRYRVCPWCWCRQYVMPLYDRLMRLFDTDASRNAYKLFEIHAHIPFDWNEFGLDHVQNYMAASRATYMKEVFGRLPKLDGDWNVYREIQCHENLFQTLLAKVAGGTMVYPRYLFHRLQERRRHGRASEGAPNRPSPPVSHTAEGQTRRDFRRFAIHPKCRKTTYRAAAVIHEHSLSQGY